MAKAEENRGGRDAWAPWRGPCRTTFRGKLGEADAGRGQLGEADAGRGPGADWFG